jgi:hypothetical protein
MLINQSVNQSRLIQPALPCVLEDFSLETRQLKGENHRTTSPGAEVENEWIYSCTLYRNDNFTIQIVCKGEYLIIVVQDMEKWWH